MSSCGSCTLCCKIMGVPELDKLPGEWCKHVDKKKGCTIYEDRPPNCRDFNCVWLQAQNREGDNLMKAADLRPDRCKGVIVTTEKSGGIMVKMDPHRPNGYRTGSLARLIKATPKLPWLAQVAGVRAGKAINETAIRLCYRQGLVPTHIEAKDDWIEDEIRRRRERTDTDASNEVPTGE